MFFLGHLIIKANDGFMKYFQKSDCTLFKILKIWVKILYRQHLEYYHKSLEKQNHIKNNLHNFSQVKTQKL